MERNGWHSLERYSQEAKSLTKVVEENLKIGVSRPSKTEKQKALEKLDKFVKKQKPTTEDINYKEIRYQHFKEKYDL